MADENDAGVTPPPPPVAPSPNLSLAPSPNLSLAPPLVHPPSGQVAGAPPQPPYAHPRAQIRPAPEGNGKLIAIVVVSLVLLIGAALVASVALVTSQTADSPPGVAAPTEPGESAASDAPAPPDDADSTTSTTSTEIGTQLEKKIAEYKRARDTGSLWATIPDTEFNRTALMAFLYTLTDMKVATIWGVDDATAQEYAAEMARLEEQLLSEQPLGTDIEIVMSDKTFRYDGDTGEGGYFDE